MRKYVAGNLKRGKRFLGIILCLMVLLCCQMSTYAANEPYVASIAALKTNAPEQRLIVKVKENTYAKTMTDLGDILVVVDDRADGSRVCYIPDITFLRDFADEMNAELSHAAAENSFYYYDENTKHFQVFPGAVYFQIGDAGVEAIYHALLGMLADKSTKDCTIELSDDCLISKSIDIPDEVLANKYSVKGSCTTSMKGSSSNRINNIRIAAGNLNMLVLWPGQEISISEVFKPRTAENGYRNAGAYLAGKVVQATGGGICQASSTTYNAAMNSGLTVTERHPHSMPVHYLPLGLDAAISSGLKDLHIRNDYPFPVLFEAYTEGTNLTVRVYTNELLTAGRSYRLHSVRTGSLSAKTYLEISEGGAVIEDRLIHVSKYSPMSEEE